MDDRTDLVFINASNPTHFRDQNVRRTIRRRAMRDIGKARRKAKNPPAVTFTWQPLEPPVPCLDSYPRPWPGGIDSDPRSRELIHFMHADAEYNYRPFRKVWFAMALSDQSAFILCKANAAMFLEKARLRDGDEFRYEHCAETLGYYGQCVREVTRRLSDPVDCVSEGVFTAILGLICHDLYVGTLDRWAYHIRGLARIVSMRGGIGDLDANLQLFACWFDVVGSVARDLPPQMPPASVYLDGLATYAEGKQTCGMRLDGILDDIRNMQSSEDTDIYCLVGILERMAALAGFVNEHSSREPGFWKSEDDMRPLRLLGPVTHDLLSMPRANPCTFNGFQVIREMARLVILILLGGVKTKYGMSAPEINTLQTKLSTLVLVTAKRQMVLPFPLLQLWCLVVAALLASGPARKMYVQEISSHIKGINIPDGTGAVAAARDVIWIEDLASADTISFLIFDIDMVYTDEQR
ncbi:uncharacterized protein APUU_60880S [Aspergillus puulaauensis]|uniref:Uncharacterized protein n=1 Tax=Aspergillus puulaauensis TaxID=1220207 RepID=A0A7R7XU83_9EURO|nr:uncharacterized protein APUU_60880S [Aspergillus puulaauensis]BCS27832.1 hypothetical protein APUU_60880S [Aspergillus puulaauensis]